MGTAESPFQHANVVLQLEEGPCCPCSVGLLEGSPILQPDKAKQINSGRTAAADSY